MLKMGASKGVASVEQQIDCHHDELLDNINKYPNSFHCKRASSYILPLINRMLQLCIVDQITFFFSLAPSTSLAPNDVVCFTRLLFIGCGCAQAAATQSESQSINNLHIVHIPESVKCVLGKAEDANIAPFMSLQGITKRKQTSTIDCSFLENQ